ncbi:hypothetical protein BDP27DRAFT_1418132 [Rhodocollybia butyracea]|uniref:Uncharacterized protein n=1 Tax=Rhodocollybia butyracea TaxID=206335 RepID=A0A9P5Q1W1_9AGAR|nr:hypothetical protein BDP27DRAFT_1418132 [Rhodocollybia butyracea]
MACRAKYSDRPTAHKPLPPFVASTSERAKALLGIYITSMARGEVANFDLEEFQRCRDSRNDTTCHPLTVGLGERTGKYGITFANLSVQLCSTKECRLFAKFITKKCTLPERQVLVKKYVEWLVDMGEFHAMKVMKNNLAPLLGLGIDHPAFQYLHVCLTWSINFYPDNNPTSMPLSSSTTTSSSSRSTQSTPYMQASVTRASRSSHSIVYTPTPASCGDKRKRDVSPATPTPSSKCQKTGKGKGKRIFRDIDIIDLTGDAENLESLATLISDCKFIKGVADDNMMRAPRIIQALSELKDTLKIAV